LRNDFMDYIVAFRRPSRLKEGCSQD